MYEISFDNLFRTAYDCSGNCLADPKAQVMAPLIGLRGSVVHFAQYMVFPDSIYLQISFLKIYNDI